MRNHGPKKLLPVIFAAVLAQNTGRAATREEQIREYVPKGVVIDRLWDDVTVKTAAGSKVRLEFQRDGGLDEASGVNLGSGDDFEPGGGVLSLHSAARRIAMAGERLDGCWSFERDVVHGWVYRFRSKGLKAEARDFLVSAKDGRPLPSDSVSSP